MDWILIFAIFLAAWAMLSVLSGERMNQSQRAALALAVAAAEEAMSKEKGIPIARSSEIAPIARGPDRRAAGK